MGVIADAMFLVGFGCIVLGMWLIGWPAIFITGGIALILMAIGVHWRADR